MNAIISELRQKKVMRLLSEKDLDAVIICNAGAGSYDDWLLGRDGITILPPFHRNSMVIFYRDGNYDLCAARTPHPTERELFKVFEADLLKGHISRNRLGIVNPDDLKLVVFQKLQAQFGAVQLVDLSREFDFLQAQKSPKESAGYEKAYKLYDQLFAAIPMLLRPYRYERDVVVDIRQRALELGADEEDLGLLTQVWLISGPSDAAVLAWPGKQLKSGELIDLRVCGGVPGCQYATLGRSYVLGHATSELRNTWDIITAAQTEVMQLLVPGKTLREAAATVKDKGLVQSGLWMHGIGSSWNEIPRLTDDSADMPLEEGMTIAVSIKAACSAGSMNCTDVYAVVTGGARRLSKTPQKLFEV